MKPDLAHQLGEWLSATDIGRLELRGPGVHVRLRNQGGVVSAVRPGDETWLTAHEAVPVPAPSVGVFRRAHPLRDEPLAVPGQRVVRGQTIALLQVGALLLPVTAPQDGVVAGHAAADGAVVGYGAALVDLIPATAS